MTFLYYVLIIFLTWKRLLAAQETNPTFNISSIEELKTTWDSISYSIEARITKTSELNLDTTFIISGREISITSEFETPILFMVSSSEAGFKLENGGLKLKGFSFRLQVISQSIAPLFFLSSDSYLILSDCELNLDGNDWSRPIVSSLKNNYIYVNSTILSLVNIKNTAFGLFLLKENSIFKLENINIHGITLTGDIVAYEKAILIIAVGCADIHIKNISVILSSQSFSDFISLFECINVTLQSVQVVSLKSQQQSNFIQIISAVCVIMSDVSFKDCRFENSQFINFININSTLLMDKIFIDGLQSQGTSPNIYIEHGNDVVCTQFGMKNSVLERLITLWNLNTLNFSDSLMMDNISENILVYCLQSITVGFSNLVLSTNIFKSVIKFENNRLDLNLNLERIFISNNNINKMNGNSEVIAMIGEGGCYFTVNLRCLELSSNKISAGFVIFFYVTAGEMNINNSSFCKQSSVDKSTLIYTEYFTSIFISFCVFRENTLNLVFMDPTLKVYCSLFELNEIIDDSLLRVENQAMKIIITGCRFLHNTCTYSILKMESVVSSTLILHLTSAEFNLCQNHGGFLFSRVDYGVSVLVVTESYLRGNYAMAGGAIKFYSLQGVMLIRESSFIDNKAVSDGGAISVLNDYTSFFHTFSCKFIGNSALYAGFINLILGNYYDTNSIFSYNQARRKGGLIRAGSYSKTVFIDSFFMESCSNMSHNVLLTGNTQNYFYNITMVNFISQINGAAFGIFYKALLAVWKASFRGIRAKNGALLFLVFSYRIPWFIDCDIIESGSEESFVYIKSSDAIFYSVNFTNITGRVFEAENSNLLINVSTIFSVTCKALHYGCILKVQEIPPVILAGVKVENCKSKSEKGMINFYRGELSLHECLFINTTAIKIDVLFADSSNVNITNSQFLNYPSIATKVLGKSNLYLYSTVFSAKKDSRSSQAIYFDSLLIEISYSEFNHHENGALYFRSNLLSKAEIPNVISYTIFVNNKNIEGGALALFYSDLHLKNCTFIENKVDKAGGAIYLLGSASNTENKFIVENCLFRKNTASQSGGGAVYWEFIRPDLQGNNIFDDNQAKYGNDLASRPIWIRWVGDIDENVNTLRINNFLSGQMFKKPLEFHIKDYYNNTVEIENPSLCKASLQSYFGENFSYYNNTNNFIALIGTTNSLANFGSFSFDRMTLIAMPNSSQALLVECDSIANYYSIFFKESAISIESASGIVSHINASDNSYKFMIKISFGECELGYLYDHSLNLCRPCQIGYYSLNHNDDVCLACPENAFCPGRNVIVVKQNYWRESVFSDEIFACGNKYSCKGGETEDVCQYGFTGNLCSECKRGDNIEQTYFLDFDRNCKPCTSSEQKRATATVVCVVVLLSIYIGFLIREKIKSTQHLPAVMLKMFTEYIQCMAVILSTDINWPFKFEDILTINIDINKPDNLVIPFECNLHFVMGSSMNIYFKKIVVLMMAFYLMPIPIVGFWYIYGKFSKYQGYVIRDRIYLSLMIAFFTYQPSFINQFFGALNCKKLGEKYYLRAFISQKCWDDDHNTFVYYLILPSLFFLMIIIPALVLYKVVKRRRMRVYSESDDKNLYSFFTSGYKGKYDYWDFFMMTQKYALILIVSFTNSILNSGMGLIMVIFLFVVCQMACAPFENEYMNKICFHSKIGIFSAILFIFVFGVNPHKLIIWFFSLLFLFTNGSFILRHFLFYYTMNETLMNYFHKFCWCLPIKKFRVNKKDGTKIFYNNDFRRNFSITLKIMTKSRNSNSNELSTDRDRMQIHDLT